MYANDMFSSLYFAFVRKRFLNALETAAQQNQPERAFQRWTDAEWVLVLARLRHFLLDELPSYLESAIGSPGHRDYLRRGRCSNGA